MFGYFGVRRRLLLAFFGISAFAVLAAGTAMYSFIEVGDAVDRITQRRVPLALASLELSRHVERIVAVAPALLAVATPKQHEEMSGKIDTQLERLNELFTALKTSDIDASTLNSIEHNVKWLRLNLTNLDGLVAGQLSSAEFMEDMLSDLSKKHRAIDELIAPRTRDLDAQASRLRDALNDPAVSTSERTEYAVRLAETIALSLLMQKIQAEAARVDNILRQAASASRAVELEGLVASLRRSVATLETLAKGLDPERRSSALEVIGELQSFIKGRGGIVGTRRYVLDNIAHGRRLLRDSTQASRQLTGVVDQLVDDATGDIESASADARSVQRFSTWVLIAAVALSLVSSTLIVWLYVGRNLIARLTALSDSTLAIARGNLRAELPTTGKDEIGQMAEALIVFRDTAVEVEENNLREIHEARQRLLDAIESISEGFSLYDANNRLVLCNSRYRDVLYPGVADMASL